MRADVHVVELAQVVFILLRRDGRREQLVEEVQLIACKLAYNELMFDPGELIRLSDYTRPLVD